MNRYPRDYAAFFKGLTNREVIVALHKALDQDYTQLREGAARVWERRFAGNDPADACVSVRVSPSMTEFAPQGYGLRATADRLQGVYDWNMDAAHMFDDAA